MRKSYNAFVANDATMGIAKGQVEDCGGQVKHVLPITRIVVFEADEEAVEVIKTISAIRAVEERDEVLETTGVDADLGRHWLD